MLSINKKVLVKCSDEPASKINSENEKYKPDEYLKLSNEEYEYLNKKNKMGFNKRSLSVGRRINDHPYQIKVKEKIDSIYEERNKRRNLKQNEKEYEYNQFKNINTTNGVDYILLLFIVGM